MAALSEFYYAHNMAPLNASTIHPPNKVVKFASIGIGVVIAGLLLVMGFNLLSGVFSRAADSAPQNVVVGDITTNSVKVNWTTDQEVISTVEYGTSPTALNFFAPEADKKKEHSVELTLLSPNTTYYFQINVGGDKHDNGGVPWTFTTKGSGSASDAPAPTGTTAQPTATQLSPAPTSTASGTTSASPSPIQTLTVPDDSSTVQVACTETDCNKIRAKLGKGCSTSDYFKCITKATPTP